MPKYNSQVVLHITGFFCFKRDQSSEGHAPIDINLTNKLLFYRTIYCCRQTVVEMRTVIHQLNYIINGTIIHQYINKPNKNAISLYHMTANVGMSDELIAMIPLSINGQVTKI